MIDDLPPKDRELLQSVLEEREKDEVCRQLGVNRDYLRVLLHRAKNQFRERYAEQEKEREKAGGSGARLRAGGSAGW